jgi:mRNA-capping enzyme
VLLILNSRLVPRKRAFLFVGGHTVPFAEMKMSKEIRDLDKKIIECKFENNTWVFMRERTDKSYPNAYKTAIGKLLDLNR